MIAVEIDVVGGFLVLILLLERRGSSHDDH